MRERERIQQEVDKILAFSSQKEWSNFLKTKGIAHKHYYHYTTLGALNAILKSSHWRMSRVDLSNDPLENPVHSTSFTTSCLSSMGMWNMYSKLSSTDDIGVRIGIPQQTFKEKQFGKTKNFKINYILLLQIYWEESWKLPKFSCQENMSNGEISSF